MNCKSLGKCDCRMQNANKARISGGLFGTDFRVSVSSTKGFSKTTQACPRSPGMDLTLRKIAENKDYKVAWFPDSGFWQEMFLRGSGSPWSLTTFSPSSSSSSSAPFVRLSLCGSAVPRSCLSHRFVLALPERKLKDRLPLLTVCKIPAVESRAPANNAW